ncbi:MAG: oligosaccharide flippase family protein [Cellvibrionaceae bacterium]|nr:oligosaccharide flippase family protein [Cellvibrionaceae bacterium]
MAKQKLKDLFKPGGSLKRRTLQGSAAVFMGDAYQHAVRLSANLVMTRLLYPEAFGLMLIVSLVLMAVDMLSDAGIHSAVILKSHGREEDYLNSAWAMLIIRGAIMCVITMILAWPISLAYEQPILFPLIAIASLNALIMGFASPRRMIYDRDVNKIPVVCWDMLAQTLSLAIGILWLWFYPTVWVLVIIGIVSTSIKTISSFYFFKGPRPRFELQPDVVRAIFDYGKWIFLSSALTFLAYHGDKFVVSTLVTTEQLGIFGIAITLAKVTEMISGSLNMKLLLPVYAELQRSDDGASAKKGFKVKVGLFLFCLPIVLIFSLFGDAVVAFLYDPRYHDAGWMLQVMALGALFAVYNDTLATLILSKAQSLTYTLLYSCRVFILFMSIFLGGYFYGLTGVIYGIAVAPALFYPFLGIYVRRYGIYTMRVDFFSVLLVLSIVIPFWLYVGWPGINGGH